MYNYLGPCVVTYTMKLGDTAASACSDEPICDSDSNSRLTQKSYSNSDSDSNQVWFQFWFQQKMESFQNQFRFQSLNCA